MTVMRAKMRRPSGDWPIPRRTSSWAGTWVMSRAVELDRARACGCSRPLIVLSVVVLPAPLAPSRVTISPARTSRSMPCRAWMRP